MNLLLFEPGELDGEGRARITGRRARHLREVLAATAGDDLRAGVVRGPMGIATLQSSVDDEVVLRFEAREPPSPRPAIDLVVAVPRPKVVARLLQHVVCMGVGRVELINAWRVEKAYLDSPKLSPDAMADELRLGCEQGRHTWVPEVVIHRRFMAFCDALPEPGRDPRRRFVAQPGAPSWLPASSGAAVIALGPEGGFLGRELASLEERGFAPVCLGPAILRTEVAAVAALAQWSRLQAPV